MKSVTAGTSFVANCIFFLFEAYAETIPANQLIFLGVKQPSLDALASALKLIPPEFFAEFGCLIMFG
jgi:hypothetical protein